ncbi:hypothetical protein DT23_17765 [Thioclava indica]|uniref:Uncharacterized protein n=1 Tax=Thioclava indica TaxID=1353528 RepID=A0A074JG47_9RHOB|nr:hypothetical protein DT23_17765 [Thioclava indica]
MIRLLADILCQIIGLGSRGYGVSICALLAAKPALMSQAILRGLLWPQNARWRVSSDA